MVTELLLTSGGSEFCQFEWVSLKGSLKLDNGFNAGRT